MNSNVNVYEHTSKYKYMYICIYKDIHIYLSVLYIHIKILINNHLKIKTYVITHRFTYRGRIFIAGL